MSRGNMNAAYKRVMSNKGSGGVDNMGLEELLPYLKSHGEDLTASILNGRYKPNPVRRVEIPKDNGKKRQLGIPTLVDRVIQQSLSQVLSSIYEPKFSASSYGFRPNRSAHDALLCSKEVVNQGYTYCVDLDLEKFFDTVNHSFLLRLLSFTIKDGRVISLIHKYLKAGVMANGIVQESNVGTPQGGPLSPLLSNIVLNELDKELEKRGHPFVRYADDCVIFCKTPRGAILHGLLPENVYRNSDIKNPALSGEMLLHSLRKGDILLVKASRGAAAERVIEYLKANKDRISD